MELSVVQIALTALIVFAAFVVRGMSGFGSSLVAMPLLVFVMPIHVAVPLMGLLVFVLFCFLLVRDRRDVIWREVWLLLAPTLVGVATGIYLFTTLDNTLLLKCLGGVTIAYAVYALAVHYFGLPGVECSERWAIVAGFCGSFIDTMFGGGGGTVIVIYMHLRRIGKVQFRATAAVLWFFEMTARVLGYTVAGYYSLGALGLVALMLPVMWLGTWCGEHIHSRISQATFSKLLAVLLMASGITLLLR
ncbi:MAG: sulfite exporter TauE/SafE family protein [Proteobacteria bacterium]|nr:sulfite exporter TauE/SafE family protein [Pseudomonadota bacterium]